MLVEDDINLNDIYKARLEAEGYQVFSAKDGEEALAIAIKERPYLILSDIMMPKFSGFDMIDILRGNETIKDTKIIVMTALNKAEDEVRANKLNVDRYLVKSQVTLEDVVKAVHDVLDDIPLPATTTVPEASQAPPVQVAAPANQVVAPPKVPVAVRPVLSEPVVRPTIKPLITRPMISSSTPISAAPSASPTTSQQAAVLSQIQDFVDNQERASRAAQNQSSTPAITPPTAQSTPQTSPILATPPTIQPINVGSVAIANKKVIQPISNPSPRLDINALLAKEEANPSQAIATSTDGIFRPS